MEAAVMKALLIPLLIVATSAFAVMTVRYAHRASAERVRADAAQTASQKSEARIRELEQSRESLEQQLMEAQRPRVPGEGALNVLSPTPSATTPSVPQVVELVSPTPADGPLGRVALQPLSRSSRQGMSPSAERYMRRQRTAMVRQQFQDVGNVLGLSQEQTRKLLEVLDEQQTRGYSPFMRDYENRFLPDSVQKTVREARERGDAAVSAVIGESRMAQWATYQKSMPERMVVNGISRTIEHVGVPALTDDQREQLVTAMVDNRDRTPPPSLDDSQSNEQRMEHIFKQQDENNRRNLERAKGVLTTEQYEAYRDYIDFQAEMNRNIGRNSALQSATFTSMFTGGDEKPPQK